MTNTARKKTNSTYAGFQNALYNQYQFIPLEESETSISIGVADVADIHLFELLSFVSGKKIVPVSTPEPELRLALSRIFLDDSDCHAQALSGKKGPHNGQSSSAAPPHSPVIDLINKIIGEAIDSGASDIHFEPFETGLLIRMRYDGLLKEFDTLPEAKRPEIISRIKVMAALDIAERRKPQDGRFRILHNEKDIDIRVSSLPTHYGEKIVLRILDRSRVLLDLSFLGMGDKNLTIMKKCIARPHGLILLTGPTGSGKTTTLYAALNHIKSETLNISTVEDPIEYDLPGINQTHIKPDIGLTFASCLRSLLRQDPNVIMIGEIRDKETADIAVRASLTGHLVLSTLHTNDSASAITRLQDLGIEKFLLSSSLTLIIAQRLVRKICTHCKEKTTAPHNGNMAIQASYVGKGCPECNMTGYKGRIGLFELLYVSDTIQQMILENKNAAGIAHAAKLEGLKTLREDGADKVTSGMTTYEEVLRETSDV